MPKRLAVRVRFSAAAVAGLAALALSGCAVIDELAYHQRSSSYEDLAAAPDSSPAHAAWVPDDAHSIRITESTQPDAANAVVLVTSSSPLDPELCAEVDRQSAPSYAVDGAPDVYRADTVFACGEWSVVSSEDGWFGWTPNHPEERAQSVG
ncbi:hypothetical protein [Microbacterium immunditiarum]|uniref:Lipoprotein n=1 Tax=Microbacterium immunditiarum TaxID=337480 RepID=A0A7Y9GL07_9MICO|nr:hypothetical protein [Microbacterium immunditiarum]NYE18421.1 hypothetical protein [Microbacterium immunditiarum]